MNNSQQCSSLFKSTSIASFTLIVIVLLTSSKWIHSHSSASQVTSSLHSQSHLADDAFQYTKDAHHQARLPHFNRVNNLRSSTSAAAASAAASSSSSSSSPSFTLDKSQSMINDAPALSGSDYTPAIELIKHTGTSGNFNSVRHHDLHSFGAARPPKQT